MDRPLSNNGTNGTVRQRNASASGGKESNAAAPADGSPTSESHGIGEATRLPPDVGSMEPYWLLKLAVVALSLGFIIGHSYYPTLFVGLVTRFYPPAAPAVPVVVPPQEPLSVVLPVTPVPDFSTDYEFTITEDVTRKTAVVDAFKHAWRAYERDAWGFDNYHPISRSGTNLGEHDVGIGYMIVDVLDTMMIMAEQEKDNELRSMVNRAEEWVTKELDFDEGGTVNTFETTIRLLGGLLSAHHLRAAYAPDLAADKSSVYLDKAVDLADRLLPSFNTPFGLPLTNTDLRRKKGKGDEDNNGWCSTAEATTLQLEFKFLSHLTDDSIYWRVVEKVMYTVVNAFPERAPPLPPIFIDPESGKFVPYDIRLGSRGDSYYEYLLKQYLQTNRTEPVYRQMYDSTMNAVHEFLFKRTPLRKTLHTVEMIPGRKQGRPHWETHAKQDHLVCFLGGSLLLGATEAHGTLPPVFADMEDEADTRRRDWQSGQDLIESCMETHRTATGLSPEIAMFDGNPREMDPLDDREWYIKGNRLGETLLDARYILRPETVESLFIAYRLTGDQKYRDWGWQIFQSIEKHCKLEGGGYTSIRNVDRIEGEEGRLNVMETFFLGETLKYLYLMFSDATVIPLTDYVFNTEAHPLPIFTPTIQPNLS